jgi:hypothetical protein
LTPFSALPVVPFAFLDPLSAKRAWVLFNLALLAGTIAILARLSEVSWQWLTIAATLSFPLYRNLEYGQYYVVILLLLTAALWAHLKRRSFTAGLLLAIAVGIKIFPVVLVFFFLRKRDWRAVWGLAAGLGAVSLVSILVFGTTLNDRFLSEILPAALRGEAMDPYNLAASSISALLHHLFIFEPQLNLRPLVHAPWLVALLQPSLQMLVLGPAILFCAPTRDDERDSLEWSCLVIATLAISTLPASYHFVLLLLPCAVCAGYLLRHRRYVLLAASIAFYFLIGSPIWPSSGQTGWHALASVPRLWSVLLLTGLFYFLLLKNGFVRSNPEWLWTAALTAVCLAQVCALWNHERKLYTTSQWQITTGPSIFSAASPAIGNGGITFSAMTIQGWRVAHLTGRDTVRVENSHVDQLASTSREGIEWVEVDGAAPALINTSVPNARVENAEHPTLSANGDRLAFIREDQGKGSLWIRDGNAHTETRITGPRYDVYDIAFSGERTVLFSGTNTTGVVQLFKYQDDGQIDPLGIEQARYPSLSPDGKWLAYSTLKRGIWHLTIRDWQSGAALPIETSDCNDFSPVWEQDSHTLVYVSDCGRGLWQTAMLRRKVIPGT